MFCSLAKELLSYCAKQDPDSLTVEDEHTVITWMIVFKAGQTCASQAFRLNIVLQEVFD